MPASLHANAAIRAIFFAALVLALAAAGCVHRVELRQGDARVFQNAPALSAGMSRAEVEELLGVPQTESPFRADRWMYVYKRREPGFFGKTGTFVLKITFEDKRVKEFEIQEEGEFPEFESDETEAETDSESESETEPEPESESEAESESEDSEKGEAI